MSYEDASMGERHENFNDHKHRIFTSDRGSFRNRRQRPTKSARLAIGKQGDLRYRHERPSGHAVTRGARHDAIRTGRGQGQPERGNGDNAGRYGPLSLRIMDILFRSLGSRRDLRLLRQGILDSFAFGKNEAHGLGHGYGYWIQTGFGSGRLLVGQALSRTRASGFDQSGEGSRR